MKKLTALLTALALILGLCACSAAATWQEQYDLGVRYLSEGNYQEAIIAFNAAIEIDPKQVDVYMNLVDAYIALGNLDSALQTLRDGYAATGDARLQARIDELTALAPTPTVGNLTWSLIDGTLTISGTGPMEDYEDGTAPWYKDRYSITKVVIEDGVTSIGNHAFYECNSLTSVDIPDSVTSIGDNAFQFCGSLIGVTIPDSVTSIKWGAFGSCESLTGIDISVNVTYIGEGAFNNCTNLSSINVASGNAYYVSVDGILFNAEKTALLAYPAGKIGAYSIPNSVTRIESWSFDGCSGLTRMTIPNSVTSIGAETFRGCSSLTSVAIPDSVTSIEDGVFWDCSGLIIMTIPNNITTIKSSTFEGCSSLTGITIPNSVTSIGLRVFYGCDSLKDIYYGGSEAQWNQIAIDGYNDPLVNATIHYNS